MTSKPLSGLPRLRRPWLAGLIPLVVALIAGFLALPGLLSQDYRRSTIENIASSLTGREVHINGRFSLALLPHPQFIAQDIVITNPARETVTANALTMDLAPIPLLRGRIKARNITLQSPRIGLPWPLPGGAAAITPPRWLAALHGQIVDGEVSLGAIVFRHVNASIVTGGDGTLAVSGSAEAGAHAIELGLNFAAASASGTAPVGITLKMGRSLSARLQGSFDSGGVLAGRVDFAAGLATLDPQLQPLSGSADINAGAAAIVLGGLTLRQGAGSLTGGATLTLSPLTLDLGLSGGNLVLPVSDRLLARVQAGIPLPAQLRLQLADTQLTTPLGPIALSHLDGAFGVSAAGISEALQASMGGSRFALSGTIDSGGAVQAKASLASENLAGLLSPDAAPLPPDWQSARLAGDLSGNAGALRLDHLSGSLGPARVSGDLALFNSQNLYASLHFDRLDLAPAAAALQHPEGLLPLRLRSDVQLTADRASLGRVALQHLLIDARLDGQALIVRRLTAGLYGGTAGLSFTYAPAAGQPAAFTSARAVLDLPSAQPLAALLPPGLQPPAAVLQAPLSMALAAAGPARALATSATLSLGAFDVTAAPVIDLTQGTASGALTLRHPDAIAALQAFGYPAGLSWPGPGSIALRADAQLSDDAIALPGFVLSLGDLTANGRLAVSGGRISGAIAADTLALPVPAGFGPLRRLLALRGDIGISASRVWLARTPLLGEATARLNLAGDGGQLQIQQAQAAGGGVHGSVAVALTPPGSAPAFSARLNLTGADAAQLPAIGFPLTLDAGQLDAAADLTAAGDDPRSLIASLSGTVSLTARSGRLGGFDLAGAALALQAPSRNPRRLRAACTAGQTGFSRIDLAGRLQDGIYQIASASLAGGAGSASLTGRVDLRAATLALELSLLPDTRPPARLAVGLSGPWGAARKTLLPARRAGAP